MGEAEALALPIQVELTAGETINLIAMVDIMLLAGVQAQDVRDEAVRARHKLHEALGDFGDMVPQP